MNGDYIIFLFGEIIYKNLLTKKLYLYRWAVRLQFGNKIGYDFIVNDNIEY